MFINFEGLVSHSNFCSDSFWLTVRSLVETEMIIIVSHTQSTKTGTIHLSMLVQITLGTYDWLLPNLSEAWMKINRHQSNPKNRQEYWSLFKSLLQKKDKSDQKSALSLFKSFFIGKFGSVQSNFKIRKV